jgi:hypothetical protein
VAALPLSQRSSSGAFDLTYTLPGPPYAVASICVPSNAHVTISWASNDTLPGFYFSVQPPDTAPSVFRRGAGSATFDSGGGSFFIAAMNYSSPAGIVHVDYGWVEQGNLYQLYVAPQPDCPALQEHARVGDRGKPGRIPCDRQKVRDNRADLVG